MSDVDAEILRECSRCSTDLPPGALECERCHALVHSAKLDQLSTEAKGFETQQQFRQAREQWLLCLPLLPPRSKQADWIRDHARALDAAADQQEAPESDNKWAKKLGPVGPIAILLAKSKAVLGAIFKLKFLLSFFAFFSIYAALFGARFGIGFAALILIHEMGHFIDIKRRGLPADMPVFLPGLGAYVRWRALGVSLGTRAAVSLAGPLAGAVAAVACSVMWWKTRNGVWAALGSMGAVLNVLNLIPVWVLDGGQAALALSKLERIGLLTLSLALWLAFGQGIFFLVAAGSGYRVFTKDMPPHHHRGIALYFAAVLIVFALILRALPPSPGGY